MKNNFKVMDLNCGIGGMSKAFMNAGYQVVQAIDHDGVKGQIYESILKNTFLCDELKNLDPSRLPDVDVITCRLNILQSSMRKNGEFNSRFEESNNILRFIEVKKPEVFLVETTVNFITICKGEISRDFMNRAVNMGYSLNYKGLDTNDYTMLPIKDSKLYFIGIRNDNLISKWEFPAGGNPVKELDYQRFFEPFADDWYWKIRLHVSIDIEENNLYVRKRGEISRTNAIYTQGMYEMFVAVNNGLRRFTHNEMAQCKGLEKYNYNKCSNKVKMYQYIAESTNVYVATAIAKSIRQILNPELVLHENWKQLISIGEKAEDESNGLEYEAEEVNETVELPYKPEDIRIDQKVISLFQIYRWIDQDILDLRPDFQRNFVWDIERKSLLIESLMLKIPIPAFYFDENEEGLKTVIDGMQRLSTVYDFLKDNFELKGLQYLVDCNGLKYSELEKKYRMRIEDTQLAVNILDAKCPSMVKFDVFRRINTGGVALNPQEVRNIMANPKTRKLLLDMVVSEEFVKGTRNRVNDMRMGAQELCLRFLTYYQLYDSKLGGFTDFKEMTQLLDNMILKINRMNSEELDNALLLFKKSMKLCTILFGVYAFSKPNTGSIINRALFTSWSIVLVKKKYSEERLYEKKVDAIRLFREKVSSNAEYFNAISSSTSSRKNMTIQFRYAEEILEELDV